VAAGNLYGTRRQHVRAAKTPPSTEPPLARKLGGGTTTGTLCIPGGTNTGGLGAGMAGGVRERQGVVQE